MGSSLASPPPLFTREIKFTGSAIVAGMPITVAHGLGYQPDIKNIEAKMVCGTADIGLAVGTELDAPVSPGDGGSGAGGAGTVSILMWADATNIKMRVGPGGVLMLHATTGHLATLTLTSWTMDFRVKV